VVGKEETLFSQKAACLRCGISMPELTPQMFSFNNLRVPVPIAAGWE